MQSWQHLGHALGTMVSLVNTGPEVAGEDLLDYLPNVRQFINDRTITEVEAPTDADLTALKALRRRLRAVVVAPDAASRTHLVNSLLDSAVIAPRLVEHDNLGLHMHFFPPYASLSEHLRADCAMALALLITSGESERLRVCNAPDCARALLDESRNRSRTYCDSRTCGNRLHAAAYRARQRTDPAGSVTVA